MSVNILDNLRSCDLCALAQTRTQVVVGEGPKNAALFFIGEAPGKVNDVEGKPFVGHGGAIFNGILGALNLKRSEVYISNAVKCWPPENRRPKPIEIKTCKPFLLEELNYIQPRLIVCLGLTSFRTLIDNNKEPLKDLVDRRFHYNNIPLMVTYHPNALRYVKGGKKTIVQNIALGMRTAQIDTANIDSDQLNLL